MSAVRDVDRRASHWRLLRESPMTENIRARAQSRDARRGASAAYERNAQTAQPGVGDPVAKPPTARSSP